MESSHEPDAVRRQSSALVVFVRGANVGGHRRFRPSILARELSGYDVVNVGAAGTFIVWNGADRAKLRAELKRRLPFDATVAVCKGRDLLRLETSDPFASERPHADGTRFVSILSTSARAKVAIPVVIPPRGKWFVRVIAAEDRFVCGVYRPHMKTIGYLGQIDQLFGTRATTRSWSTIRAITRLLRET